MAEADTTDDDFLGGKLRLRQPRRGHRAGHDAMLLAAATAAVAGQRIVDLGAGVGAAGLAVATRVPGIALTLVEIDPALAGIAAFNASTNGIPATVVAADVAASETDALPAGGFDGVLMNPPFHDSVRHRASPDAARRVAHSATQATLPQWIGAAHRLLAPRGTLTLIWRADGLADVLAALAIRFGSIAIQPLHGARGKPALRIVLRAIKGGRAPLILHEGVVLDGGDARVERALRGEGVLPLGERAPS